MVITQRDVLANQTHLHVQKNVLGIMIVMTFMHVNYELNIAENKE